MVKRMETGLSSDLSLGARVDLGSLPPQEPHSPAARARKVLQTRNQIRILRRLTDRKRAPDEFLEVLGNMLDGTLSKGAHLRDVTFYRARHMGNDLFWHVSNLGYPPHGKTSKGRLNREGDPILYAAFSPAAALVEIQARIRQIIAIAVIEELPGHADQVQFFPIGIPPSSLYATPFRDTRERLAQEYLYDEITRRVDAGREYQYNSTIAIADNFLNKPVLRPRDGVRLAAGLIYPSVRAGQHLDGNSYNIALKPHVFDAHYKIVEVTACAAIPISQSDFRIETLNKATVRENGYLEWDYNTFTAMVSAHSFLHDYI